MGVEESSRGGEFSHDRVLVSRAALELGLELGAERVSHFFNYRDENICAL